MDDKDYLDTMIDIKSDHNIVQECKRGDVRAILTKVTPLVEIGRTVDVTLEAL
jgi:hypothetical protein